MNKSLFIRLLFCLSALSVCLPAVLSPSAAAVKYEYGEEYKSSPYYEKLTALQMTGDQRYDLIAVALSQVGYHEGNSDADMDGQNYSGNRNFVEYTRLYGKLDNGEGNGTSYGYAWCAAFVSWCLRQAGIPEDLVITEVSCPRFIKFLSSAGIYRTRESRYSPLPGDLIFFKNAGSTATSTHIGIVVGTSDGHVYTVEGNADDNVTQRRYERTDSYIVGYGTPGYTVKEGTKYDFPLTVTGSYPAGEYVVTADSLNVRKGPGTSHPVVSALSAGDRVTVTETDGGWGNIGSGWISLSYAVSVDKISYLISFDAGDGKNPPRAVRKFAGKPAVIPTGVPEQQGFTFSGWAEKKGGEIKYLPGDTFSDDASVTLYAVWKPEKVTMRFLDDDGTLLFEAEYDFGSDLRSDPPAAPEKPDADGFSYEFAGWSPELTRYVKFPTDYVAVWTKTALTAPETSNEETSAAASSSGCASVISVQAIPAILCIAAVVLFRRRGKDRRKAGS